MLPIAPGALLAICCLGACTTSTKTTAAPDVRETARTYTTEFSVAENAISEKGMWITGKVAGFDWADIAVTPGLAYGVESGTDGYDDSTAVLTGSWGPDQTAQGTVHTRNQNNDVIEEVELRLRSSLSAHRAAGYEINFRCSKTPNAYAEIVRWNGPLGKFTYLNRASGAKYGVTDGDIVTATAVGNLITAYINGVPVLEATDGTYPTGSPGMGFFLRGATGVNRDYGFTSFRASGAPRAGSGADGTKQIIPRRYETEHSAQHSTTPIS